MGAVGCSLVGVVSERGGCVEATEEPVPVFDGYESTVQQTVSASWLLSAINEPAMSTSGLPAALGEGAAR